MLIAAVGLGVSVTVSTELLQALSSSWARPGPLLALWSILCTLAAIYAATGTRPSAEPATDPLSSGPEEGPLLGWSPSAVALILGLVVLAAVLALVGWLSPPNNFDVQCYHLVRVRTWLQQGNISPYPSPDSRQLFMGTASPYLQLHLMALAGSDRWANTPQLWAWLQTVCAAGLLARALGAGRTVMLAAAVLAGTIPTAVLQASTAQTDLAVTGWLIRHRRRRRRGCGCRCGHRAAVYALRCGQLRSGQRDLRPLQLRRSDRFPLLARPRRLRGGPQLWLCG